MDEPNGDKVLIPPRALVKVTQMNHIVEVQYMEKMNRKNNIKKIDHDHYVYLETGEIREFEHSTNRSQNYNSLRQSMKKLKYYINNNFTGLGNELHLTLTYKREMRDLKEVYRDFDKFFKRLRYAYKDKTTIDYINVVEPHESGEWHCHCLLRFNDLKSIYISNPKMREFWRQGFVTLKALKNVDNIGAYLSAYLADVEMSAELSCQSVLKIAEERRDIVVKKVDGKEKKFIKGGRLHLYPPGTNIFRKSKGIEFPESKMLRYEDIKRVVGSAKPHYSRTYHIQNDDFENTISFEQYNTKRN